MAAFDAKRNELEHSGAQRCNALLSNPLYIGKIRHRGALMPAVTKRSWTLIRSMLRKNAWPYRLLRADTGLLFDETGDRLSPSHAVKQGRRYRYYISHRLATARRQKGDGWRLPAREIEQLVLNELERLLPDGPRLLDLAGIDTSAGVLGPVLKKATRTAEIFSGSDAIQVRQLLREMLHRVVVHPNRVCLEINAQRLSAWLQDNQSAQTEPSAKPDLRTIEVEARLQRRGLEARLVVRDGTSTVGRRPDRNLTALIAQAHRCLSLLTTGQLASMNDVAKAESMPASEVSRILPLAFLAPDIINSVLAGNQPVSLTAERLKRLPELPFDWIDQRKLLGFLPSNR